MTAQFLHQPVPTPDKERFGAGNGFDAFGKPVPYWRRQAGMEHCREMGLSTEESFHTIEGMCDGIARDDPYEAMKKAMVHLDLTGTYRLLAVLLTAKGN